MRMRGQGGGGATMPRERRRPEHGLRQQGAELQFFCGDGATNSFDQDELFRSTAKMLGKGRLGITYRVTLQTGGGPAVVVVKRLRNMSQVPRRDFTRTMQLLGKLVVYEHVPGCSLFQLLHGNRGGEGRTPLSWPARVSIAQGVARGLPYLHRSLPAFHHSARSPSSSTGTFPVTRSSSTRGSV